MLHADVTWAAIERAVAAASTVKIRIHFMSRPVSIVCRPSGNGSALFVPSPTSAVTGKTGRFSRSRRALVIDFWAAWCAPCRRLKSETLESPAVTPLLSKAEFVSIDIDAEPGLGRFYGVSSIPLVLFVDAKGRIVDRLMGFEPPEAFLDRLRKALSGDAADVRD